MQRQLPIVTGQLAQALKGLGRVGTTKSILCKLVKEKEERNPDK
jgi:hypothetical protein